jgi:SAM-dependent methyltransferase
VTGPGSELVDYEAAATRYHGGRAIPAEQLDRWGTAVRPHLRGPGRGGGRLRVLDLGAGTGIFAAAWPAWGATHVVAVEVAAGMIAERQAPAPYVRGQAERLPLTAGSIDLVWASTSFHHFRDQAAAVAEIDRVLAPAGRVMIRALLPERSALGWIGVFPGRERALGRCIAVDGYAARFRPAGFRVAHVEEVVGRSFTFGEAAAWVEQMRHADSLLTALTDDEVAAGVRVLRATPDETDGMELSLVVLARGA